MIFLLTEMTGTILFFSNFTIIFDIQNMNAYFIVRPLIYYENIDVYDLKKFASSKVTVAGEI